MCMRKKINDLIIETEILGEVETNSYLVYSELHSDCVLVDLGDVPSRHLKTIHDRNLNLKYVLLTHGHYDHIKGLDLIPGDSHAEILISPNDADCITHAEKNLSCFVGVPFQCQRTFTVMDFSKPLSAGKMEIRFFSTPGHTMGSVCIMINDVLFSGDTVFKQSIGRTDLPGGDYSTIVSSLKFICGTFPDETVIFPGHGDSTILKLEKNANPFLSSFI